MDGCSWEKENAIQNRDLFFFLGLSRFCPMLSIANCLF